MNGQGQWWVGKVGGRGWEEVIWMGEWVGGLVVRWGDGGEKWGFWRVVVLLLLLFDGGGGWYGELVGEGPLLKIFKLIYLTI